MHGKGYVGAHLFEMVLYLTHCLRIIYPQMSCVIFLSLHFCFGGFQILVRDNYPGL